MHLQDRCTPVALRGMGIGVVARVGRVSDSVALAGFGVISNRRAALCRIERRVMARVVGGGRLRRVVSIRRIRRRLFLGVGFLAVITLIRLRRISAAAVRVRAASAFGAVDRAVELTGSLDGRVVRDPASAVFVLASFHDELLSISEEYRGGMTD